MEVGTLPSLPVTSVGTTPDVMFSEDCVVTSLTPCDVLSYVVLPPGTTELALVDMNRTRCSHCSPLYSKGHTHNPLLNL